MGLNNSDGSIAKFRKELTAEGEKSETTIKAYVADVRAFAVWFSESNGEPFVSPDQITSQDLKEYRQHLIAVKHLAPATINRRLSSIRQYLFWANSRGLLPRGIPPLPKEVKVNTQGRVAPKCLTKQDYDALLRVVERYGSLRDQVIIKLDLNTGLRVSELCNLERRDIQIRPRGGEVIVRQGKGGKYREVPLNVDTRRELERYLQKYPGNPDAPLFSGTRGIKRAGMTPRSIQKMFTKYKRLAGIDDPEITVHSLRHTFADRLVRSGRPLSEIQYLLGHSRLSTTGIYIKPNPQDLQNAVDSLCQ